MHPATPLQQVDRVCVLDHGQPLFYFGGCDYFRMASHPHVLRAARQALRDYGLNVAAARTTTGNHALYEELESALARFFGVSRAILTPSGYTANMVVAQALAPAVTHAFLDEKAHSSLADAAIILQVPVVSFPHRDAVALARLIRHAGSRSRPVVFTDGLFARDGAIAPIRDYLALLPESGWLVVDDAHAAGVLGVRGRGTPEHCQACSPRLIHTGTLSKAFGAYGGIILAAPVVARHVWAHGRQFSGSTPLPLPLASAALAALPLLEGPTERRRRLHQNAERVKRLLRAAGLDILDTPCPVVSVQTRRPEGTRRLQRSLRKAGIFPSFIRYAGGPSAGFFRFAISSEHPAEVLDRLAATLLGESTLAAVH